MSSHRASVAAGTGRPGQPRPPRCAPSEPFGAVINPRGEGRWAPTSRAPRESGSAARRARSSGCQGVGVRVRSAKLCLLGSGNLAGVCPGPKLAKRVHGTAGCPPGISETLVGRSVTVVGKKKKKAKTKGMKGRSV